MDLKNREEIKEEVEVETKRLIHSFKYAGTGIITSLKKEKNMKIHFMAMLVVIILGIVFKISAFEWIACVILFAGVIGSEMFNTAIETVVDMVTPYKDPKAKIAKDVAAGGVLVWAIVSVIVGGIIFIPKIIDLF
ncbi:MAG: diacylglycerol kinase family protein [Clostridia bacterium]|nr:diacylglycerol kinase family protein [Clostridia bacterium]